MNRGVSKREIDPLRANDAIAVYDDESHLGELSHHAHRPFGTQLHIVLCRDLQFGVRENWKGRSRFLNDLRSLVTRIYADTNHLRACLLELSYLLLQLTELLLTCASGKAHVERQHILFSITWLKRIRFALRVGQRERGRGFADKCPNAERVR